MAKRRISSGRHAMISAAISGVFTAACGGGFTTSANYQREAQIEQKPERARKISPFASAGDYSLSSFSRANCLNNESISWDKHFFDWRMKVHSLATNDLGVQEYATCDVTGARCGAVSWGGGLQAGKWTVNGEHYITYESKDQYAYLTDYYCNPDEFMSSGSVDFDLCQRTVATTCNLSEW